MCHPSSCPYIGTSENSRGTPTFILKGRGAGGGCSKTARGPCTEQGHQSLKLPFSITNSSVSRWVLITVFSSPHRMVQARLPASPIMSLNAIGPQRNFFAEDPPIGYPLIYGIIIVGLSGRCILSTMQPLPSFWGCLPPSLGVMHGFHEKKQALGTPSALLGRAAGIPGQCLSMLLMQAEGRPAGGQHCVLLHLRHELACSCMRLN